MNFSFSATLRRLAAILGFLLSLCIVGGSASAGVLISTVPVNAVAGEKISVHVNANSGYYGAALSWQYFNAAGQVLGYGNSAYIEGPTQFDIAAPCGVDQPSMNASYLEIYNDTPGFYATATGTANKAADAEIASDASGVAAGDADEARCGQTLFGALAKVDAGNPEDGKYWKVHLEKGEKLSINGWAVSQNPTYGAAFEVQIRQNANQSWTSLDAVAPYGFTKFGGGYFVAPAAGNYTLRALCTAFRVCKFAIHLTINGRQCPPPYACPCSLDQGSKHQPVELAHGRERSDFGSDLDVTNPLGPDVAFGRMWTEALALQKVASPGLSRGWTHSYDIRLNAYGSHDLQIQFPNGGQEILTAVLDGNGAPTGVINAPSGAPYKIQGVVNPMQFNPNDANDPVTKQWLGVEVTWDDGSRWSFVPAPDRYLYRLDRQTNATGQYLQFAYNADGTLATISNQASANLLTLSYNTAGQLQLIVDAYGRRIAYAWSQPAGVPEPTLSVVSVLHTTVTSSPPTYQQYYYCLKR